MKITSKVIVAALSLSLSAYAFAACPSGTYAINFINNTSNDLSVQVQDYTSGANLTPSQSVAVNQNTTLCFAENDQQNQPYTEYKLMQYTSNGNLEDNITAQTLINNQYFMQIYATDSNFKSAS